MTDHPQDANIGVTLAQIMGPVTPRSAYQPGGEYGQVEVKILDTTRVFLVADYEKYFVNLSFREHRWAYNNLAAIADRIATVDKVRQTLHRKIAETEWNHGDPAMIDQTFKEWAVRHIDISLLAIRAYENQASPMVTGPSKFPTRRMEKRINAQDKREQALRDDVPRGIRHLEQIAWPNGAPGDAIRANDPEAIAKIEAQIADLTAMQEFMKQANAALRRAVKTADPAAFLKEAGYSERRVNEMLTPNYMGKTVAFPSYMLSNNSANIRRLKARLTELQAMAEQENIERDIETADGIVTYAENTEAARVQFLFPGKPSAEIRQILKRNGFRWAPSQSAWQRQLTSNGKDAAARVIALLSA